MSRRDTIIIAVLANAGLLAILFMMAINSDDDKVTDQPEINNALVVATREPVAQHYPEVGQSLQTTPGDEMDNVLKEFQTQNAPQSIVIDDKGEYNFEKEIPETKPVPASAPITIVEQDESIQAPTKSAKTEKYVEVTVKKGDFLDKLARANGTTVDAIMKANNLTSDKLKIGQILRIPVNTKSTKAAAATPTKSSDTKVASGDIQYYTIMNGDNPWKIAKKFGVKFEDLLKLNNLNEDKARNMKPGDKIRVR